MGTSRSIAVVGLRTTPHSGLRSDMATALTVARRRPHLWLLGMLGFALRGGIVLLALPIMVLPTQVEVRLALGNNLTSMGFTDGFWLLVTGASLLSLVALLVALHALARVQIGAFEQLVRDPASDEHRGGLQPRVLDNDARRPLVMRLFIIQAIGLLALLGSAVPMAAAIGDATLSEIVAPSSSQVIYVRVLNQVRELVALVIGALVLVELLAATASRRVLTRAYGLTPRGSLASNPLRMAFVAATGWLLFVATVLVAMLAIDGAWQQTSLAFLSVGWAGQGEQVVALTGAATLLAAVFSIALLACGFVSAFRANLWSLASLR